MNTRRSGLWRTALAIGVAAAALTPGGCAKQQRALISVRTDADRAFRLGNYEAARADYQEYVDRSGATDYAADVRLNLARSQLMLKQPGPAVENATIAYDLRPDDEQALETLAEALRGSGRLEEMYRLLRAQTEDRGRVKDYLRLARFAEKAGDADGAEQAFLTAAKIDGGRTVEPQIALGDFYARLGNKAKALERYRMALWFDATDQAVNQKIRGLGQIPGPSLRLRPTELSAEASVPTGGDMSGGR